MQHDMTRQHPFQVHHLESTLATRTSELDRLRDTVQQSEAEHGDLMESTVKEMEGYVEENIKMAQEVSEGE